MAEMLRKIDHAIHKVLLLIAEVSLVMMVILITYTVILRFVFNTGVGWAEEVPRLMVTVFVFMACAMGVRDHVHMTVNVIYNRFKKDGAWRKAFIVLGDLCVLLCGLFMLVEGGSRVLRMMRLSGTLPMTGLPNWVRYISVPVAGAVIIYDCILFLTGVLKPDDLMYSDPEVDYSAQVMHEKKNITKGAAE
ncbi:MAG: TRAP transporter small permease [Clostridiales bacterium]|nr:TRAP transporter small permease [Clostridiales bacterium]